MDVIFLCKQLELFQIINDFIGKVFLYNNDVII